MYKKIIILLSLFLAGAMQLAAKQDPEGFPIVEKGLNPNPPIPRTPSTVQIGCEYDLSFQQITAYLSGVTGTTEVVWENLDTGESYDDQLVGSGVFYLPFSCSSGLWRITFTLQSGAVYSGQFEL